MGRSKKPAAARRGKPKLRKRQQRPPRHGKLAFALIILALLMLVGSGVAYWYWSDPGWRRSEKGWMESMEITIILLGSAGSLLLIIGAVLAVRSSLGVKEPPDETDDEQ